MQASKHGKHTKRSILQFSKKDTKQNQKEREKEKRNEKFKSEFAVQRKTCKAYTDRERGRERGREREKERRQTDGHMQTRTTHAKAHGNQVRVRPKKMPEV